MAKNLHFTDEQEKQAEYLLEELQKRGVHLLDPKRGLPSISALVRHLMDEEYKRLTSSKQPTSAD